MGEQLTIAFMIIIFLIIFGFSMFIVISQVNIICFNFKCDLFCANRAGLIAIDKNQGSVDNIVYDEAEFLKHFKNIFIKNYSLDSNMRNGKGIVEYVDLIDYKVEENKVKTKIGIKVKPIILRKLLENIFYFQIEEETYIQLNI